MSSVPYEITRASSESARYASSPRYTQTSVSEDPSQVTLEDTALQKHIQASLGQLSQSNLSAIKDFDTCSESHEQSLRKRWKRRTNGIRGPVIHAVSVSHSARPRDVLIMNNSTTEASVGLGSWDANEQSVNAGNLVIMFDNQ